MSDNIPSELYRVRNSPMGLLETAEAHQVREGTKKLNKCRWIEFVEYET
jgi:hypothetical protein